MDSWKQWAFSVCVALVTCGIAQMILPKNGMEKVFRLTISVFFLCCLLSPAVLQNPQLRLDIQEYTQEDMQRRADRLLQVVEEQSDAAMLDGVREIIADKLEEMGINYTSITINIKTNGQNEPEVETVEIILDRRHEDQHHSIVSELKKTFDLQFRLGYRSEEEVEG